MFICDMVLRCAGIIKTRLESGPVIADRTTTVVHRSKLLINDVKPDHSLAYFKMLDNCRQTADVILRTKSWKIDVKTNVYDVNRLYFSLVFFFFFWCLTLSTKMNNMSRNKKKKFLKIRHI